ncbi:amidohydrolase family protein [Streptomyces sp. NBC_00154]|uniref:amidohydrolase family protein n=1 Tax=Streptomyces sp. NBC_00154 TaxID=2975670 RepID=UPI0022503AEE|nr:amidohydrolase family protein [Streptomyces sp. NBC_00154]MCX5315581.1 amidohydrolase family protein [Streptomyces sp. NBC_00154]
MNITTPLASDTSPSSARPGWARDFLAHPGISAAHRGRENDQPAGGFVRLRPGRRHRGQATLGITERTTSASPVTLCASWPTHLGGALPLLPRRLDDHPAFESPETPELPSIAVGRLWYDTVSHVHSPALVAAAASFGADRLVLGTDFPYEDGEVFLRAVDYIVNSGLAPEEVSMILDTNAADLLGLSGP